MPHDHEPDDTAPCNPIAVTLAVWLGLIVCVMGVTRLSDDAAAQANVEQAANPSAGIGGDETSPFNPRLMAFGG